MEWYITETIHYNCFHLENLRSLGYFRAILKVGYLNPFLANVLILHPLKTRENQRLTGVYKWYKMETLVKNGLISNLKILAGKIQETATFPKIILSITNETQYPLDLYHRIRLR